MFEDLKLTAEKAEHKYFTVKQQYDTLNHEAQVVQNQLTIAHEKLDTETLEREEVSAKEKRLDNELTQIRQHLDHFKTAYAELDDRKVHEIEILTKEIDDANFREREYKSKLELQDRAMFDLEEENRQLKKDLSQTRADCENMLKIMEDNEVELSLH